MERTTPPPHSLGNVAGLQTTSHPKRIISDAPPPPYLVWTGYLPPLVRSAGSGGTSLKSVRRGVSGTWRSSQLPPTLPWQTRARPVVVPATTSGLLTAVTATVAVKVQRPLWLVLPVDSDQVHTRSKAQQGSF